MVEQQIHELLMLVRAGAAAIVVGGVVVGVRRCAG